MQKDQVPNVRMNVAKTIQSLGTQFRSSKENIVSNLAALTFLGRYDQDFETNEL